MSAAVMPEGALAIQEAPSLLCDRSLSPSQIVSENAGPYGLHVPSASIGLALYVAPSALAEVLI